MRDLIDRQAVIEINRSYHGQMPNEVNHRIWKEINNLPSAQPEHTNSCYTNSWCIDCKEYDTEKHSCPRFNRVIKQTLDEIYSHAETEAEARFHAERKKGKWIYGESEAGNDGYYCSKCGNFVPWKYDEYDIDFIKEFLFCNKCGAEMEGQDE